MHAIPHLCHVFSTFGRGGPQVRTAGVIKSLGSSFRHTIVAVDGNLSSRELFESWMTGPEADLEAGGSSPQVEFVALDQRARGRVFTGGLRRLFRDLSADLVLTYNWGTIEGIVAARQLRLPIVHAEDGFNPDEAGGQKRRRVWARRLLLRQVASVVVPSWTLAEIARADWWVPDNRLLHIPNGVHMRRFRPGSAPELRAQLDVESNELLIGTVGHLAGSKNVGKPIDAVAQLLPRHSAKLLVVGDGAQRVGLEELVTALGIAERVLFVGEVADPSRHFQAMDLFAMASRTEQMPIALLEAMASGLPVIATDVGDVRRMVARENRFHVLPKDNEHAYVDGLDTLLSSADLRATLGACNRARCESRYDQGEALERYAELYCHALGLGQRRLGTDPRRRLTDRDSATSGNATTSGLEAHGQQPQPKSTVRHAVPVAASQFEGL